MMGGYDCLGVFSRRYYSEEGTMEDWSSVIDGVFRAWYYLFSMIYGFISVYLFLLFLIWLEIWYDSSLAKPFPNSI